MTSNKLEDKIRKIRALWNKARDRAVTKPEALAFAAKAKSLMANYKITEEQLVGGVSGEENFTIPVVVKSLFDSRHQVEILEGEFKTPDYEVLSSKMGGYHFWVLRAAAFCGVDAPWIRIETYSLKAKGPNTYLGLAQMLDGLDDLFVCYVYDAKLTVLRANFSMDDINYHIKDEAGIPWSLSVVKSHLHTFFGMKESYGPCELGQRAAATLTEAEHLKVQIESGPLVDLFANNDKRTKRVKNFARPFRFQALLSRPLKVKVIVGSGGLTEDSPELDGMVALRRELYDQAIDGLTMPRFDEVHGEIIRDWARRQPISNARFPGHSVLDETTDPEVAEMLAARGMLDQVTNTLLAQPKGNAMVTDVPPGEDWDVLLDVACLGPQTYGTGFWSMVCVDPQGPKDAWFDAQTIMNHPFMLSEEQATEIIEYESSKAFTSIISGDRQADIRELASKEFSNRGSWDQRRYDETFRWAITIAAIHGISYLVSPWATRQQGQTWIDGLRLNDPSKIRLPLPCGKRAQVVSASTARLRQGLQLPEIKPRSYTWVDAIGCAVVNDDDYNNIVFKAHGDPDHDDMFVLQQRTLTKDHVNVGELFRAGEKVLIMTRNPNHRGEYSVWHHQDTDEKSIWKYETKRHSKKWATNPHELQKREAWTFPKLKNNKWPTDILTAQGLALPSWSGAPVTVAKTETVIRPLPSERDKSASPDDDRKFAWRWRKFVLKFIMDNQKEGRNVDAAFIISEKRNRLGLKGLRGNPMGHTTRIQRTMKNEANNFKSYVNLAANEPDPVPGLVEIVAQIPEHIRNHGSDVLRTSRKRIFDLDLKNHQDDPSGEGPTRGELIRQVEEEVFAHLGKLDPYRRNMCILAIWRSCQTVPTALGNISDQPMWGVPMIRDWLIEAMVFFGLAGRPYVTEDGTLDRKFDVKFGEDNFWHFTCTRCNKVMYSGRIEDVKKFHKQGKTCNTCAKEAGATDLAKGGE